MINTHNYQAQTFSQNQSNILTKSFLVTGISFIFIALLGYIFGYFINKWIYESNGTQYIFICWVFSIVLIFASVFGSMKVIAKATEQPVRKMVMWIILYCVGEGFAFGMLFSLFNENTYELVLLFGVCGLVFTACAIIGKCMSTSSGYRLGKMLGVAWIVMFILMMCMFIPMILMLVNPYVAFYGFQWYYWLILGLSCFLFMGYITYDVHAIANTSQFTSLNNNTSENNMVLYYGFKLLIDLVGLVWVLARFLLILGRR